MTLNCPPDVHHHHHRAQKKENRQVAEKPHLLAATFFIRYSSNSGNVVTKKYSVLKIIISLLSCKNFSFQTHPANNLSKRIQQLIIGLTIYSSARAPVRRMTRYSFVVEFPCRSFERWWSSHRSITNK
jgi:hypothetical protein